VLFYLEHAIQDASLTKSGERRVMLRKVLHVEIDAAGKYAYLQYAPYPDYRQVRMRPISRRFWPSECG